jgi:hypothetical protein
MNIVNNRHEVSSCKYVICTHHTAFYYMKENIIVGHIAHIDASWAFILVYEVQIAE